MAGRSVDDLINMDMLDATYLTGSAAMAHDTDYGVVAGPGAFHPALHGASDAAAPAHGYAPMLSTPASSGAHPHPHLHDDGSGHGADAFLYFYPSNTPATATDTSTPPHKSEGSDGTRYRYPCSSHTASARVLVRVFSCFLP
jgi:hypothetical protein